jgi:hypothetical protein
MTFEEFFRKKKIDLLALQAAEPRLFFEFKTHYQQMGEKSFDHTKKYWFNKLRLQYHTPPEVREEKVIIENKLAEQTITETLTDDVPKPAVGFKPRFKATASADTTTSNKKDLPIKESATVTPNVNQAATIQDQHPDFQKEKDAMQAKADEMPRTTDNQEGTNTAQSTKPAGFKPRFNAKMIRGTAPQTKDTEEIKAPEAESVDNPNAEEMPASKPAGFNPRFNIKMVQPKPAEESQAELSPADPTISNDEGKAKEPNAEDAAPKLGFKPRFNKPKTSED